MKGHTQSSGSGNGSRGRSYVLMLLLAFGTAIFGVMLLHKLRERRIFNLLVKEKDRDLITLQLLLQNERDYAKAAKRKTEEMKAKIIFLRTQERVLHNRISEMQSTISSLREEQRSMESVLEDRQKEIKLLREKEVDDLNKEALAESLRQKEAEIEDLKHHLDLPVLNVLSASTDDPSNPPVKLTTKVSIARKDDKTEVNEIKNSMSDAGGSGNESVSNSDGENSTQGEDTREETEGIADWREMTKADISQEGGFRQGITTGEKSIDDSREKNAEDSQGGGGFGVVNGGEATVGIGSYGVEVQMPRDEDGDVKTIDSKERGKGGMNLERPVHSRNGESYRLRGNRANVGKAKGRRWRIIAKNRVSENKGKSKDYGVASIKGRRFSTDALQSETNNRLEDGEPHNMRNESGQEDDKLELSEELQQGEGFRSKMNDQVGLEHRDKKAASNGERMETKGEKSENGALEIKKAVVSNNVELPKQESYEDEAENRSSKVGNTYRHQQVERVSEDEVPLNKTVDRAGDARDGKPDEVGQSEEQANGIQQPIERSDVDKVDNDYIQAEIAEKYDEPRNLEDENNHNFDADKKEYGNETDEPEF